MLSDNTAIVIYPHNDRSITRYEPREIFVTNQTDCNATRNTRTCTTSRSAVERDGASSRKYPYVRVLGYRCRCMYPDRSSHTACERENANARVSTLTKIADTLPARADSREPYADDISSRSRIPAVRSNGNVTR